MYPMALLLWNRAAIQGMKQIKIGTYLDHIDDYSSDLLQLCGWEQRHSGTGCQAGGTSNCSAVRGHF